MTPLDRALQVVIGLLAMLAIAAPLGTIWGLALLWPLLALRLGPARLGWRSPLLGGVLMLSVWAAATLLWTPAPETASDKIMQWALVLLPGLLIAVSLRSLPGALARRLAMAAMAGLAAGLLLLATEILFDDPLYRLINGTAPPHPDGRSQHNRSLVLLAILVWPATLWIYRQLGWRLAAALLLIVSGTVMTGDSHSAMLALQSGAVIAALTLWRPKVALWAVRLALCLTLLGALPLAQAMFESGLSENAALDRNWRHRVDIWAAAVEHWQEKPATGWGLSASRALPPAGTETFYSRFSPSRIMLHPHNLPIQTALELGLIGLVLLIVPLLALTRLPAAMTPAGTAIRLAALAAGFAAAQSAFGAWQGWWLAGLIFAGIVIRLVDDPPADTPLKDRSSPQAARP